MKTIVIATRNRGKLAEVATSLDDAGVEIRSLDDYPGMPEVIEDGDTFIENARKKAREVSIHTGQPALADDSGLVVDALGGEPGVRSARFAATTDERNAKLLRMMEDVPDGERTARFVCVLALVKPDGSEWTATGECRGMITREQSGEEGFGYDPVFLYPPLGKTFAEISRDEKNVISHRGRALSAFRNAMRNGLLD